MKLNEHECCFLEVAVPEAHNALHFKASVALCGL
jgi:hypothetical protein